MQLVCHNTIPESGYKVGDAVTDPAAIAEIEANPVLRASFGAVADGTFPTTHAAPVAPKSFTTPIVTPVSSSTTTTSAA